MKDRIVGIDIGTNCGWCVLDTQERRIDSGTWRLDPSRRIEKGREPPATRWRLMRKHCAELLAQHGDRVITIAAEEVIRHAGPRAGHVHGGLRALLELAADDAGVPIRWINTTAWQKFITGKGQAKREVYTPTIGRRFGLILDVEKNEDEAAALGLAVTALALRENELRGG